ncbi:pyridoxamine 5'-phosphate oxidase family protein [Fibrella aquatica]|uniref:pyridoxamine 5'-phosphate oxidase family protein n=1 Tax=Fibrella aquatica TaxID=3242487 RepID=UPI003520D1D1
MTNQTTLSSEEFDAIKQAINNIRVAFLTTQGPNGTLRTRPMVTHQLDADGTMWFFTRDNSIKAAHIRLHPGIALGFSDLQSQVSAATAGEAEIVKDQAKIDALWNDSLHEWFPEGKDDPNIVLIRVTTQDGHCWE